MSQLHLLGPTPDPAQSQWFTPDWLAERIVEWAGPLRYSRVVELGAGDGAFVRPLLAAGAYVAAVERDPRFAAVLRTIEAPRGKLVVCEGDALDHQTLAGQTGFSAYVGNPPYEDDADLEFVLRGLELAPRVVVVMRLVFLAGQDRYRYLWSRHHLAGIAFLPERPEFVGASSGGARSDFAVLDIWRGPAPVGHRVTTEWWTHEGLKLAAGQQEEALRRV